MARDPPRRPHGCCWRSLSPPTSAAAAVVAVEEAAVPTNPPTPTPPATITFTPSGTGGANSLALTRDLERPELDRAVARGDLGHRPLRRRVRPEISRRRARVRRGHRGHLPRSERERRHLAPGGGDRPAARWWSVSAGWGRCPGAPGPARCFVSSSTDAPPALATSSSATTRRSTPRARRSPACNGPPAESWCRDRRDPLLEHPGPGARGLRADRPRAGSASTPAGRRSTTTSTSATCAPSCSRTCCAGRCATSAIGSTQVMNLTDVDDKTINGAAQAPASRSTSTPRRFIDSFFADLDRLHVERAEHYPRATEHVPEMIELIERLIESGYAYVERRLGLVPHRERPRLRPPVGLRPVGRRGAASGWPSDEYDKEDVRDFVLWKAAKPGEPAWDSPWGPGRPGWHIECSAMSMKYLGRDLRHPLRRRRQHLPAPRERDRAERVGHRRAVRPLLAARRAPDRRRPEDVEVAGQPVHARRPARPAARDRAPCATCCSRSTTGRSSTSPSTRSSGGRGAAAGRRDALPARPRARDGAAASDAVDRRRDAAGSRLRGGAAPTTSTSPRRSPPCSASCARSTSRSRSGASAPATAKRGAAPCARSTACSASSTRRSGQRAATRRPRPVWPRARSSALVAEREAARTRRDFRRSDAIRDELPRRRGRGRGHRAGPALDAASERDDDTAGSRRRLRSSAAHPRAAAGPGRTPPASSWLERRATGSSSATSSTAAARSTSWPRDGDTLCFVEIKARADDELRPGDRGRRPAQAAPAGPLRRALPRQPRGPGSRRAASTCWASSARRAPGDTSWSAARSKRPRRSRFDSTPAGR